jgi:hypothetical protein
VNRNEQSKFDQKVSWNNSINLLFGNEPMKRIIFPWWKMNSLSSQLLDIGEQFWK